MMAKTEGGDYAANWRCRIQRTHEYAIAMARDIQTRAQTTTSVKHNAAVNPSYEQTIKVGDSVWLYMARVKPGLSKKLAHLWHGPFRVIDKKDQFMVKLKMGTEYKFFPWVHSSRLKLRTEFPERPDPRLEELADEYDLDAALFTRRQLGSRQ